MAPGMADAPSSPVHVTRDGAVANLVLDRPEGRGSFDVATLDQLYAAASRLSADPEVRAVVLSGSGKVFCAGADLGEMKRRKDEAGRLFDELTVRYHALLALMQRSDTVFVAAVNGVAAGGGVGLALSADLVVMGRSARFVLAYANLGVSPDGGVTAHLVRALGPHRARAALLLDDGIDARQAHAWGLVNQVVDDAEVIQAAGEMARRAAARSRHTRLEAKRLVAMATHSPTELILEEERATIIRGAETPSFQEGLGAVLEKRAPRFVETDR